MKYAYAPLAAAAVIILTGCQAGKQAPKSVTVPLHSHEYTAGYARQTSAVRDGCMPDRLKAVLLSIRKQTGRTPILTSALRTNSGRKGSLHRHCLAADIRVPGVSDSTVVAAALSAPGIGGVGTYCDGIIHVDVGPKRRWKDC